MTLTELPTAGSRGDASDAPAAIAPAAGPTPAPSSSSGSAGGELGQGNSETALHVSICPSFYATLLFILLWGELFRHHLREFQLETRPESFHFVLFIYVTIFRRMLLRCLAPLRLYTVVLVVMQSFV